MLDDFFYGKFITDSDFREFLFFEFDIGGIEGVPSGDGGACSFGEEFFLFYFENDGIGFSLCVFCEDGKESFDDEVVYFVFSCFEFLRWHACGIDCRVCRITFFAFVRHQIFFVEECSGELFVRDLFCERVK